MNAKYYAQEFDYEVEDVEVGRTRREAVRLRKSDNTRRAHGKARRSNVPGGVHQRRNKHWSW